MRYFLSRDSEKVWYCIPNGLKDSWTRLNKKPNCHDYDGWEQFESMKIDILTLTFENPSID